MYSRDVKLTSGQIHTTGLLVGQIYGTNSEASAGSGGASSHGPSRGSGNSSGDRPSGCLQSNHRAN